MYSYIVGFVLVIFWPNTKQTVAQICHRRGNMSLDLSFDRIRRPQCNLFRFHRHRSPGTTRVMTSALPPSVLHWSLAGCNDVTRAQFIVSHRASGFAGTAMCISSQPSTHHLSTMWAHHWKFPVTHHANNLHDIK